VTSNKVSSALKFVDNTRAQQLRADGVQLFHATVSPGELLYMPAGYWVVQTCVNKEKTFGIRTNILCKACTLTVSMPMEP
jgi:hypothetical protein